MWPFLLWNIYKYSVTFGINEKIGWLQGRLSSLSKTHVTSLWVSFCSLLQGNIFVNIQHTHIFYDNPDITSIILVLQEIPILFVIQRHCNVVNDLKQMKSFAKKSIDRLLNIWIRFSNVTCKTKHHKIWILYKSDVTRTASVPDVQIVGRRPLDCGISATFGSND